MYINQSMTYAKPLCYPQLLNQSGQLQQQVAAQYIRCCCCSVAAWADEPDQTSHL
jgi:hypothetical protein